MRPFTSSAPKTPYLHLFLQNPDSLSPGHSFSYHQSRDYNQFFYFFHRPNEKMRIGPFTIEENELFLNTLSSFYQKRDIKALELQGNWGLFALFMPQRNGLACYSHYQNLRSQGIIEKSNNLLRNVKDFEGFLEFFMNLEPGFKETINQSELLRKMNKDIEPFIREILDIRLKNNNQNKASSYKICENKEEFLDFLRNSKGKKREDLEISAKSLNFEEFKIKNSKIIRKKLKTEEESNDFTHSQVKIKQEADFSHESKETITLYKNSSIKKPRKRNFPSMIEKAEEKKEKILYFGFNLAEGWDSEPNLDHIFEKFNRKRKLGFHSENEEKSLDLKRKNEGKMKKINRKERKIFKYQEEREVRRRLKKNPQEIEIEEKIMKKEENFKRKRIFLEDYEENGMEIEESKNFPEKKTRKIRTFRDFSSFLMNFKTLRNQILDFYSNFKGLLEIPLEKGDFLVNFELKSLMKHLKTLKNQLNLYKFEENLDFSLETSRISSILKGKSMISNEITEDLDKIIKELIFSKPMSAFSLINCKTMAFNKVLLNLWTLLMKILEFLGKNGLKNLKATISLFLQLNFEALALNLVLNDENTKDFNEITGLLGIFMKMSLFIEENRPFSLILSEKIIGFYENLRISISKANSVLFTKKSNKFLKKIMENQGFFVPIAVFAENPQLLTENRYFSYIFTLFPLENLENMKNFFANPTFMRLSMDFILFFELSNENPKELLLFIEKSLFSSCFPIENQEDFENFIQISDFLLKSYSLLDLGFFLKIKEKLLFSLKTKAFSIENIENRIENLFLIAFSNEKGVFSNENQVSIIEKRVFSRVLCSFKTYEKFHGDFLRNPEFQAFQIEAFLLKTLISQFKTEFFLINLFKFLRKFMKNTENSHFRIKSLIFELHKQILNNLIEILIIPKENGLISEVFEDFYLRFLEIFIEMREITVFLNRNSINPNNTTENERNMELYRDELREKTEEILEFFKTFLIQKPHFLGLFIHFLNKFAEKTSLFVTFNLENPVFCSVREKFLGLLLILFNNIEEFMEKNTETEAFYQKIAAFSEEWLFPRLLELINSMYFLYKNSLNKPFQEKIALKFQISMNLLHLACEVLGFSANFMLFSTNSSQNLIETLNFHFLDLNSTLFLDNSIKIVYKYDKFPYITLTKPDKIYIILLILSTFLRNLPRKLNFTMKNGLFEEFLEKTYGIFTLGLFLLRKDVILRKIASSLEEFQRTFSFSSLKSRENHQFISLFEVKSLFSAAFTEKSLENPLKILKNILENNENLMKSKTLMDLFSFIVKNIKFETFNIQASQEILSNCLYMMRFLLKSLEKSTKLSKIHNDFIELLLKRPKLLSFLEHPQKGLIRNLAKYLFFLMKSQLLETLEAIFLIILSNEIKTFQFQKSSFYQVLESLDFSSKLPLLSEIFALFIRKIKSFKEEFEGLLEIAIKACFCDLGYRNSGFLTIIFINKMLVYEEIVDYGAIFRVFNKNIEKIMDFGLFSRIYEGFEVNIAEKRALESFLALISDFCLKISEIHEKIGFNEEIEAFSLKFIRILRNRLSMIICSIDRDFLRLFIENGGFSDKENKVFLMNFLGNIEKQRVFSYCAKIMELISNFSIKSPESLDFLEDLLIKCLENKPGKQDIFLENLITLIQGKKISILT